MVQKELKNKKIFMWYNVRNELGVVKAIDSQGDPNSRRLLESNMIPSLIKHNCFFSGIKWEAGQEVDDYKKFWKRFEIPLVFQ